MLLAALPEPKELTIVYMSSRQGAVAPCHCDTAPLGGVDRQLGAVEAIRAKAKSVLVIDGGDNFFESSEQAKAPDAMARAELIADTFAAIKPDVMFPGERDFLHTAPTLRELGTRARAPWLASNISPARDRPPMVLPLHVAKIDGQKVLLLGVYMKETFPAALKDEKYGFEDPEITVKRVVSQYRGYADLIVVIAHTDAQTEEKLAAIDGVTLVLSAHEGRLQFGTRPIADAQVVAAGKDGKYLVRLDLRYRTPLPKLQAGVEVQKFFREKKAMSQGLGLKDTLLFQLVPLSAEGPSNEALRTRAKAIDPVGYGK